ncbi:MAG: NAD(P)H-hydrate dehydratase, partial [Chitinophagaceae bacterium]
INTDTEKFACIGIGPGIGTGDAIQKTLLHFVANCSSPLVIDADALNCLAAVKDSLKSIPPGSILTPHPKEFERLFGKTANDFERIRLAVIKASELNCIIVLKGHHSFIATPSGNGYFNNTGNAGMARGGSGDVLTGIITALRAQQYSSRDAALLGVYLHGLAGDMAADRLSKEAMIAGDIIDHLSYAFLSLVP